MALARRYAQTMADAQELGHDVGSAFSERINASGYRGRSGENVAVQMDRADPQALGRSLVEGWVNSPGHRANMLESDWTEIGVGSAVSRDGRRYAVQVFGGGFAVPDLVQARSLIVADINQRRRAGGVDPLAVPTNWQAYVERLLIERGQGGWPDDIFEQLAALGTNLRSLGGSGLTLTRPHGITTDELVVATLESLLSQDGEAGDVLNPKYDLLGLAMRAEADSTRYLVSIMLGASDAQYLTVKVSNGTDMWLNYELDGQQTWSPPQLTREHSALPGAPLRIIGLAEREGGAVSVAIGDERELSRSSIWLVSGPTRSPTVSEVEIERLDWGD